MKFIKRGEVARMKRETGINPKTVEKWRERGHLDPYIGDDGIIDVEGFMADREQNFDPEMVRRGKKQKGGPRKKPTMEDVEEIVTKATEVRGGLPMAEANRMKANYAAALLKLELDEKSGKLIPLDQVIKEATETAGIVKQALESLPDRMAAVVAAETDQKTVKEMLKAEIRTTLETVAAARWVEG